MSGFPQRLYNTKLDKLKNRTSPRLTAYKTLTVGLAEIVAYLRRLS